jgi:hypothetical protein
MDLVIDYTSYAPETALYRYYDGYPPLFTTSKKASESLSKLHDHLNLKCDEDMEQGTQWVIIRGTSVDMTLDEFLELDAKVRIVGHSPSLFTSGSKRDMVQLLFAFKDATTATKFRLKHG